MSATGAALAFKPQIVAYVDRAVRFVAPPPAPRLTAAQMLAAASASRPGMQPATLIIDRDPSRAVGVGVGRDTTLYVNPYTGAVLGESSAATQQFFRSLENWHRWVGFGGENRDTGKALSGAANLGFL